MTPEIEYSKAATRENWNDVWSTFYQRPKANANDEEAGDEGEDMFEKAGVAAE